MYGPDRRTDSSWKSYRAVPSAYPSEQRYLVGNKTCSLTTLRYAIYACNLIMLVAGTISLAMGAWLRTDSRFRDFLSQRYRNVVEEAFWQAPTLYIFSYVLIVLGMLMVVVGMLGCCGASTGSGVLLIIYAVAVCVLMLCTISAAVYIIFKRFGIDVEVADALTYMVQNYYQGAGIVQESLDRLQQAFRCCGNGGCGDFRFLRQDPPRTCDIRCDGCHYRIMVALRIGFSAAFVIFIFVVFAELVAVVSALIIVMTSKSSRQLWLEKKGYRRSRYGNSYYWRPPEPEQFIDLNSLRSNDCPLSGRGHFEQFVTRQRY